MAISIRNPQVEKLARELAASMDLNMTDVILQALEDKRASLEERSPEPHLLETLRRISGECSALPDLDQRSADEILGYDENGVF